MAENIEIPVSVGPMNEGERVRGPDMQVELAGPKSYGFELVRVVDEASDEIKIIGNDIDAMEEGSRTPFAVIVKVSGDSLEEDLEGVLERRIHEIFNYIEGVMHLNQRDSVWIRINKDAYSKGLRLKHIGKVIQDIYKAEFPFIKHIDVELITEPEKVKEELEKAKEIYTKRDEKTKNLHEEDVDVFYGCIMCQSFAPTHVCVITPDKPALCGGINYLDARAAAKIDPEGPIFEIPKGECLDDIKGIYDKVNEVVQDKSQGAIQEITLHSVLDRPSTSCGCFEAIVFYIPEVDGFGIVDRSFKGETPMGVPFSALAGQCSGGNQVEGFCGISVAYMKSPKFIQADGGWNRVVWLPNDLKNRVMDGIPEQLVDKIATEEDVSTINELQEFLKNKNHPVVENWVDEEEDIEEDSEGFEESESVETEYEEESGIVVPTMSLPAGFGGFPPNVKIILKNAIIKAEQIIITREDDKPKKSKK
jgi:acetyl-CoA decarbonylase/synthase complex subunit beta